MPHSTAPFPVLVPERIYSYAQLVHLMHAPLVATNILAAFDAQLTVTEAEARAFHHHVLRTPALRKAYGALLRKHVFRWN